MTSKISKVVVKTTKYRDIMNELKKLDRSFVTVGVHQDQAGGRQGSEANNALIASVHEFGTYDGTIPARSFIRATFDTRNTDLRMTQRKLIERVAKGSITAERATGLLGQWAEGAIKATITRGLQEWPGLKPSTIARKNSSRPLIDTGQLRQSIRYAVHMGSRVGTEGK